MATSIITDSMIPKMDTLLHIIIYILRNNKCTMYPNELLLIFSLKK